MNKIKTLVFFDLETTGIDNLAKITELCMIACPKENILAAVNNQLPRILHKLTLCINPFKYISPTAMDITGLDNFMLEKETTFDKNTAQTITHFINHLQHPVCLIAHNGNRFDFPILQRHLNKLNMCLPSDVWCADSLKIFRQIDWCADSLQLFKQTDEPELFEQGRTEELTDILAVSRETSDIVVEPNVVKSPTTEISESENIKDFLNDGNDHLILDAIEIQTRNESTPSNRPEKHGRRRYNGSENEITPTDDSTKNLKRSSKSRRALFPGPNIPSPKQSKRLYNLRAIYQRQYGTLPEVSHYAESDVITLLKCAIATKEDFVKFVEQNSILFSEIK